MNWLAVGALFVVACFGFVIARGAPYLPTLSRQVESALELANVMPGRTLLELGCGDGKVLVAAAQTGLHVVGYELNPILFLVAWLRTRRFGRQVRVVLGDFWRKDWPEADAIFVFLLDKYMLKLDKKITQYNHKPVALVSFAFKLPNREADAEKNGVYLYEYK
ncbi:MAG TPA: methyltransferase domain-containing protein [Candidatus Saccharimonadales bacterium]|nr:methyltransferase domain-containing protein [Candidatus Saccharimonadales bacterium]